MEQPKQEKKKKITLRKNFHCAELCACSFNSSKLFSILFYSIFKVFVKIELVVSFSEISKSWVLKEISYGLSVTVKVWCRAVRSGSETSQGRQEQRG